MDFTVKDDTLYFADRTRGILTVDVSEPYFPVMLPYVPILKEALAYKLAVCGNRLIVMHTSGLSILNVNLPCSPQIISQDPMPGGASLCAEDGFIYISSHWESGGLTILDMHDCNRIWEAEQFEAPSNIKEVFVRGGYA